MTLENDGIILIPFTCNEKHLPLAQWKSIMKFIDSMIFKAMLTVLFMEGAKLWIDYSCSITVSLLRDREFLDRAYVHSPIQTRIFEVSFYWVELCTLCQNRFPFQFIFKGITRMRFLSIQARIIQSNSCWIYTVSDLVQKLNWSDSPPSLGHCCWLCKFCSGYVTAGEFNTHEWHIYYNQAKAIFAVWPMHNNYVE